MAERLWEEKDKGVQCFRTMLKMALEIKRRGEGVSSTIREETESVISPRIRN